ncbi:MAG: 16S rRNA (uracil(1498)-N(3))-methyltransferase [Alphaproteobacteria bacterium]|nr:16S rRNA (uracil(1498)-N(3))-methyltransferase [Alphaproteobacteria bacterium]
MSAENDHARLIRLFVPQEQPAAAQLCELSERQAHYLRNVMRCAVGDRLRVFDGTSGEWLAEIKEVSKKKALISFVEQIREQVNSPDIYVLASPVKKEAFDFMIEKASELGAKAFQPIACARTVIQRVNEDRLQALAVESAEQCERLDVMRILPLKTLKDFLNSMPLDKKLIFCIERTQAPMILPRLQEAETKLPLAVLIGPEGGFTPEEAEMVAAMPQAIPVSLGPRILRAETALAAALTCVQATIGDWPVK